MSDTETGIRQQADSRLHLDTSETVDLSACADCAETCTHCACYQVTGVCCDCLADSAIDLTR